MPTPSNELVHELKPRKDERPVSAARIAQARNAGELRAAFADYARAVAALLRQ